MLTLFHKITPSILSEMSDKDLAEVRTSELNTYEQWGWIHAELDKRGMQ